MCSEDYWILHITDSSSSCLSLLLGLAVRVHHLTTPLAALPCPIGHSPSTARLNSLSLHRLQRHLQLHKTLCTTHVRQGSLSFLLLELVELRVALVLLQHFEQLDNNSSSSSHPTWSSSLLHPLHTSRTPIRSSTWQLPRLRSRG